MELRNQNNSGSYGTIDQFVKTNFKLGSRVKLNEEFKEISQIIGKTETVIEGINKDVFVFYLDNLVDIYLIDETGYSKFERNDPNSQSLIYRSSNKIEEGNLLLKFKNFQKEEQTKKVITGDYKVPNNPLKKKFGFVSRFDRKVIMDCSSGFYGPVGISEIKYLFDKVQKNDLVFIYSDDQKISNSFLKYQQFGKNVIINHLKFNNQATVVGKGKLDYNSTDSKKYENFRLKIA